MAGSVYFHYFTKILYIPKDNIKIVLCYVFLFFCKPMKDFVRCLYPVYMISFSIYLHDLPSLRLFYMKSLVVDAC